MQTFGSDVVDTVLRHMNSDHREDNLIIVQANGAPDATDATMIGLDERGGVWSVHQREEDAELRIPWPMAVAERADIRKAVVFLYRDACKRLGREPRTD